MRKDGEVPKARIGEAGAGGYIAVPHEWISFLVHRFGGLDGVFVKPVVDFVVYVFRRGVGSMLRDRLDIAVQFPHIAQMGTLDATQCRSHT